VPGAKVPESQEKEKKWKCLEACLERCRHFSPFACSVDGMLEGEAKTFAKRLAAKLANELEKFHSQAHGCVNAQLSVAIVVCATHTCMRGTLDKTAHKSRLIIIVWLFGNHCIDLGMSSSWACKPMHTNPSPFIEVAWRK
jgi:hypothetical protein